ncbi:putative reverse transcriptase, RNA-dependent DNA polymerase [Tanacetum coccineum]
MWDSEFETLINNKDANEVPGKGDDDLSERNGQEKEEGASNKEDDQHVQDFRAELDNLLVQQKEGYANNTNRVSTVNPSVSAAGQGFDNADDQERIDSSTQDVNTAGPSINTASENINTGSSNINTTSPIPNDPSMQSLKATSIFDDAYDDREEVGAEADLNNLETTMNVSSIPTTRIHKDHPIEQIIRDLHSAPLTRRMSQQNLKELEPKKVIQALTDPSWIEAMQEELLQFKLQKVWTLVDLPKGKRAIGTKWVYRNKKDERGIVVRNKARLMDVKSAFLYGTIEEEVYVCQPPSFEDPQFLDKVYKVEKALYGLHQAPRAWYETLSTYLLENGYRRGTIDKTLIIKKDSKNEHVSNQRLQVQQKEDGIFISQDKYVAEILKKFDFATVKTASTLIETNKALVKDEEAEAVDVHLYRSMIRSLMYLTASRPDIMFAVCACARDSPFDLEAFSDSDYAGASLDRKSTTGGCQFLRRRLISWQCKKQTIVANSTTEAEYVAAANCCGQVLWIQNQMLDYGFNFMNTKIYIDNESTICIVKNPVFHSKTKHIEISHHFIRDSCEKKLIQVIKIHTDHNVADLLIKAFDVSSSFIAFVHRLHELESYREVVCDPLWQVAMAEELAALHQTQTWDLVPLPVGKRAIGSRWVYKIKTKSDGSIERYKARLVAKGYAQEYGMDYEETFAIVAKMTMVRTLIVVAFSNGDLNEEVFDTTSWLLSQTRRSLCNIRQFLKFLNNYFTL